jgi:GT2 family glycosyltransferase
MLALQRGQYQREQRQLAGVAGIAGLYIEDNRHWIARRFLNEHDAPWLLMVDSDIQFEPDLIDQMLAAAHSREGIRILAGNVPLDVYPTGAFYSMPQPGVFAPLRTLPPEKVFEVDMAPTAIMLIHRNVLAKIREREGECWFYRHKVEVEDGGGYPYRQFVNLGEDTSFCLRARDAGFSTWLVQGLTGVVHNNLAAMRRQLAEAEDELKRLREQVRKGAA